MPPEVLNQYQQLIQQSEQSPDAEAIPLLTQANDLLAQFSAPILSELMIEYTNQISAPQDEDPLVAIRKQELALKGQELAQEQQQFQVDQQRRVEESLRRDQVDRERIDTQEDIADIKDATARARLAQQKEMQMLNMFKKNS